MKKNNHVLTSIPLLLCAIIFSGCMLWDVEELWEKSRPKSNDKDTYTVIYNGNGSSGGTAPVDGKTYQSGAAVTVLGNTGNLARSGYTFAGWNTAANGSGTSYTAGATFTISADIILYARWVPLNANTVTLIYNGNGNTSGNVPIDSKSPYSSGAAVTVLGNTGNLARSGYTFAGWNTAANGSGTSYAAGATFTISANIILYAQWVVPSHTHKYSTAWSSNATQHWKECTFDGCYEKTETASHAPSNGVCTTCGFNNTPVNMEMVQIPAGTFTMGPDYYNLTVSVTLSAFKMSNLLVTQEQYQEVMGENPSYHNSTHAAGEVQGKRPVEQVSWYDAVEFCNKLSATESLTPVYTITGRTPATGYPITAATVTANWEANGYRLPTEAQWEYACRAGTTTNWHFGDDEGKLDNYAWYWDNSDSMTHQVGKKAANARGLYDMNGNVWEWCWDWYGHGNYPNSNQTDYTGAFSGTHRVGRGGGWYSSAESTRSAERGGYQPGYGDYGLGFRVVLPSDGNTHTHAWDTTWSFNTTQHWRECTGAGCDAKTETVDHSPSSGICTTCGYGDIPGFIEMVQIPGGTLTWHSATIALSAFKMGKYEVTQEQYEAVMGTNPSSFSSNPAAGEVQGKRPVETVTWFDAIEFCNKLSEKEGLMPVYTITGRTPATGYPIEYATVTANWENNGYRLPTEAQWEYTCRAGSTTQWHFGNNENELVNYAWYSANSSNKTHQVGKKTANAWSLYDIYGNVIEWCWDLYGGYPINDQTDYTGAGSGYNRVVHGGSWNYSDYYTRSASRLNSHPGYGDSEAGFRVVLPSDGNPHKHNYVYTVTSTSYPVQSIQTCTVCGETTGTTRSTIIGDRGPAGGIIFYVDLSGFTVQGYTGTIGTFAEYTAHYMEAAPVDEGTAEWGAYGTLIDDVTTFTDTSDDMASLIGNGRKDTQIIFNHLSTTDETGRAAQLCVGKTVTVGGTVFNDWFLPSLGELNEMYKARTHLGILYAFLWSSSQGSNYGAWHQYFANYTQNISAKYSGSIIGENGSVRAVRAF